MRAFRVGAGAGSVDQNNSGRAHPRGRLRFACKEAISAHAEWSVGVAWCRRSRRASVVDTKPIAVRRPLGDPRFSGSQRRQP